MSRFLLSWLIGYAAMVSVYGLVGFIVSWWNGRLDPGLKIQKVEASPEAVRRDVVQSIRSLATISGLLVGGISLQRAGIGVSPISLTPWTFVPCFLGSMVVFDAWFYWGHRLIHTKPLYRKIHAWHHRTRVPVVWSNNSDTALDNLVLQSYFLLAPLFLPLPAAVLVAHKLFDQVVGMVGHSGYEYSPGRLSRRPWPLPGVTFHDQHHSDLRYNYGTHFTYWDRLMKTCHPGYDDRVAELEAVVASSPAGR